MEGVDALLIGTNDLTLEMGIAGQIGHERVHDAYHQVAQACSRHRKILAMGGVYDQELAARYVAMGASMVLAGTDHVLLMEAASSRAMFLRALPLGEKG